MLETLPDQPGAVCKSLILGSWQASGLYGSRNAGCKYRINDAPCHEQDVDVRRADRAYRSIVTLVTGHPVTHIIA